MYNYRPQDNGLCLHSDNHGSLKIMLLKYSFLDDPEILRSPAILYCDIALPQHWHWCSVKPAVAVKCTPC